jgi:glycerol-3-phosphate acyltransferase PlsY
VDLTALGLVALGYLLGSIPFGVILTRAFAGKDVREGGSGNIGATNVARVAGKKLAAVVLLLDAAKGAAPVGLAVWLRPDAHLLHCAVAFAAFLGHVFPVFLTFKGGKGVATALGVLAVLLPTSALAGFVVWALVVLTVRVSSVGSLLGAVAAIITGVLRGQPVEYLGLSVLLLVAMLVTHRENVKRMLAGRENRV